MNLKSTQKHLTQIKERADTSDQKSIDQVTQFNEERKRLKEQLNEAKGDTIDLQRSIEDLNGELTKQQQDYESKIEADRVEWEAVVFDLKDQLKTSMFDASTLRMSLETAETNFEKES